MKYAYAVLGVGILVLAGVGINLHFASNDVVPMENEMFTLTSSAFEPGGMIPAKYTCDTDGAVSPPLTISNAPEGTQSFALLVEDPDIPQVVKEQRGIDAFDHWVVYAISPTTREIPEGGVVGATGLNSAGDAAYRGPCPPTEYEPTEHRYIFKLYALSGTLNFIKAPTLAEVKAALEPMVIGEAELIGVYDRAK